MKRVRAEYPYDSYYLYVVFHKREGRWYANLVPIDAKHHKRTTISYARYLMSVNLGRVLLSSEHVDHIDDDKTNDSVDNLQILTLAENNRKDHNRRGKNMVELRCPNCGELFSRPRRNTHLVKKSQSYTGCSRRCSTSFAANWQHNPDNPKYTTAIKMNVVREYKLYKDR